MIVVCLTVLLLYALPLLRRGFAFARLLEVSGSGKEEPAGVSIIICARNEEHNIAACLASVINQDYDRNKIEIIVIDDASSDSTALVAGKLLAESGIAHKLLTNKTQLGKKISLSGNIPAAAHELIVTRDADTVSTDNKWLQGIASAYKNTGADMIICPIDLFPSPGFLHSLQRIENTVLSVLSGGSAAIHRPFLCSGANLAFTKTLFTKTGGYGWHLHIPSGDDVLFLSDARRKARARIIFLKNFSAIVSTKSVDGLPALMDQKVRWAAKTTYNPDFFSRYLAAVISTCNILFLYALLYLCLSFDARILLFIIPKVTVDILLLFLGAGFMRRKNLLINAVPVALVYPLYAVVVTFAALVYKPRWK